MTWLDWLLVVAARLFLRALGRRASPEEQRVWWFAVSSIRPDPATFGNDVPEAWPPDMGAGKIFVAFGQPGRNGLSDPPKPLLEVFLTRRMLETFGNSADEMCGIQDIQLAALRNRAPSE